MDQALDVKGVINILKKESKWILLITLFATSIVGVISYFLLTPIYEARTDLLLNSPSSELTNELSSAEIETNLRLKDTYQFIISSERIMSIVVDKLDRSYQPKDLLKKMQIETSENSQIISVIVEDPDPQHSAEIANTIAETFQEEIGKLMNIDNVHILTRALVEEPPIPIKPNSLINIILAFLISLTISSAIFIFKEFFNAKLDNKQTLEKLFSLPVLGVISRIEPTGKKKGNALDERYFKLLSRGDIFSPTAETYRSLRTSIQFKSKQDGLKTFLLTSANTGDGKTITSANLAVIMAMDRKRVVFIDGDLRKPNGQTLFETNKREGLTNYLTGYSGVKDILVDTDIPNLSLISSGPIPPNPAELLSSNVMDRLLAELKELFDVVIIDSPPSIVSDTIVLATKVDACLIVVNAKQTKRNHIEACLAQLRQVKSNIIGVVLNNKKIRKQPDYYYQ